MGRNWGEGKEDLLKGSAASVNEVCCTGDYLNLKSAAAGTGKRLTAI